MNNDDRIDEIIRSAASEYNRPPATPSDDMWTAIQSARAAAPQLHVVAGGAARTAVREGDSTSPRSTPRYAWFGLAAAAMFLVATGVGIGRWTSAKPGAAERRVAGAPSLAAPVATGDAIVTPDSRDTPPADAQTAAGKGRTGAPATSLSAPRPATDRTPGGVPQNPLARGSGELRPLFPGPSRSTPSANGIQSVSYQVATQHHLQDTEALLTSFSLESRDERMNSQFAGWAKGLLSNTRLLLDSPAGDDPRRATLLQDLELVLAQIVQLSPEAPAAERELVHGSIQNGLVMTRLRSAIPADQPREITERQ